jgi:DNA-directed RNA polymerase subunit RPC12/RpoP
MAPGSGQQAKQIGGQWEGNAQAVFLGLREWRALHPKATLAEIETELDQRLGQMRAQILTDLALASQAAVVQAGERPRCPTCGGRLQDAGKHARRLLTLGNEAITLERDYATCPACGGRLFPPGR